MNDFELEKMIKQELDSCLPDTLKSRALSGKSLQRYRRMMQLRTAFILVCLLVVILCGVSEHFREHRMMVASGDITSHLGFQAIKSRQQMMSFELASAEVGVMKDMEVQ